MWSWLMPRSDISAAPPAANIFASTSNNAESRTKAKGARRIDLTLRGDTLEHYATVRRNLEGMNRWQVSMGIRSG
jgi:hypothetical protein